MTADVFGNALGNSIVDGMMPQPASGLSTSEELGMRTMGNVTKGGRLREVHPADVGRALAAVQRAQEILEASGRRYLLACAKGVETTGLKQAAKVYSNIGHRAGLQSHGARYAFAQERM